MGDNAIEICTVKGGILMSVPKNSYEQAAISLAPLETDMTLEDFLESDLEGYEYVKGELIPMPAASCGNTE